jgi:membrane-associated protein
MLAAHTAVVAVNVLDAHSLISSFGTIGIAVVLFAETGLLIGLFLPGDSLLFTAGLLCATSKSNTIHLHIGWVLLAAAAGALIGAQVGFHLGRSAGPRMLEGGKDRPRLTAATERTRAFLARYGVAKAIVLARFVPVARTLINPLIGMVRVPVRTFTIYQVLGGLVWSLGVTIAGWQLGSHIHNVDHYLLPIIAVIIALSLTPIALEVRREHRARRTPA